MALAVPFTPVNVLQYVAASEGSTTVISPATNTLILEPAGTLTGATITLPSTALYDGKVVRISCTQIVTTLIINGGTVLNSLTAFVAGGTVAYVYRAANGQWYPTP